MRSFTAMIRKEFCEQLRTYKLLILGLVFLLMGMMNPVTAKLTPLIIEEFMPSGMHIDVADPVMLDSWMQFFKNIPQIGLIVVVILFSQNISSEVEKGTLINLLTKGLKRGTVILAKFTAAGLSFTGAYWMCFLVSYLYSIYFWKMDLDMGLILTAAAGVWIFGLLLLAAGILGSVLFNGGYAGLFITGCFVMVQFLIGIAPKAAKYMPVRLVSDNMALISGQIKLKEFLIPGSITVFLTALFLMLAVGLFQKKKI